MFYIKCKYSGGGGYYWRRGQSDARRG